MLDYILVQTLLEEIKYYDVNSYKKYIKDNIIPLFELSDIVKRYFNDIDTELVKYAEEIHTLSRNIIKLAEAKLGLKFEERSLPEPKDIYEVIEYGRRFLETAFNFTSASNPFTFFIWSIRKITKVYLKAHYPELFKRNTFEKISSVLGLEEYWRPPEIKPKEIVEDYTIYAYLDFETEKQEAEDTIGGLVSKLNEKILYELSVADIKSYGSLYERPNVLEKYKERVNKMLEDIGWKQKSKIIIDFIEATFSINGLIAELARGGTYTIFNFLDEIMPLQMLGVVEIKISWRNEKNAKWGGVIRARWKL